jgi:hypothetical protein
MKLTYRSSRNLHNVFVGEPFDSPVCGIIKELEPGCYEWQIRLRKGAFNIANSCYVHLLVRFGYGSTREKALRQVIDYIKQGEWDA